MEFNVAVQMASSEIPCHNVLPLRRNATVIANVMNLEYFARNVAVSIAIVLAVKNATKENAVPNAHKAVVPQDNCARMALVCPDVKQIPIAPLTELARMDNAWIPAPMTVPAEEMQSVRLLIIVLYVSVLMDSVENRRKNVCHLNAKQMTIVT